MKTKRRGIERGDIGGSAETRGREKEGSMRSTRENMIIEIAFRFDWAEYGTRDCWSIRP